MSLDNSATFDFDKLLIAKQQEIDLHLTGSPDVIKYDAGLISDLQCDHVELFKVLDDIKLTCPTRNYAKLEHLFREKLRPMLVKHMVNEGVKLYAYLSLKVKKDSIHYERLNNSKDKMQDIGRVVFKFITKFSSAETIEKEWKDFISGYEKIYEMLTLRVNEEERYIYFLYQQFK